LCCFLNFVTRFWNLTSFQHVPHEVFVQELYASIKSVWPISWSERHLVLAMNSTGISIWCDCSSTLMCVTCCIIGKLSLCFLHKYLITHCSNSWKHLFLGLPNAFWDEFTFLNLSFICHHLQTLPSVTSNSFPLSHKCSWLEHG
jgi:hypothetical protein